MGTVRVVWWDLAGGYTYRGFMGTVRVVWWDLAGGYTYRGFMGTVRVVWWDLAGGYTYRGFMGTVRVVWWDLAGVTWLVPVTWMSPEESDEGRDGISVVFFWPSRCC